MPSFFSAGVALPADIEHRLITSITRWPEDDGRVEREKLEAVMLKAYPGTVIEHEILTSPEEGDATLRRYLDRPGGATVMAFVYWPPTIKDPRLTRVAIVPSHFHGLPISTLAAYHGPDAYLHRIAPAGQ